MLVIRGGTRPPAFLLACLVFASVALGLLPARAAASALSVELESALLDLTTRDKALRLDAIERIAGSGEAQSEDLLRLLLEGDLYLWKPEKRVVRGEKDGRRFTLYALGDGAELATVGRRDAKKVAINNTLRGAVRSALATLDLVASDRDKRLAAVRAQYASLSVPVDRIDGFLAAEADTDVAASLRLLRAMTVVADVEAEPQALADGISSLGEAYEPAALTTLNTRLAKTDDAELRGALNAAIARIEARKTRYEIIEQVIFGLSLGSILVLAAIGLAITFGVMGVINMAHGELIMLGAYTTWGMQQLLPTQPGLALVLALPAGFLVSAAVGMAMERLAISKLYGRPLETLLLTFGFSLILQQAVRTVISARNVAVSNPTWMSGSIEFNPLLSVTANRVVIFGLCLAVFAVLWWVMHRTTFGLQLRAVTQNRAMARCVGIRSRHIDTLTFGLGAGLAGIAGVALSQLGNVGPNLGQAWIVDSFLVVVFGGVGNLWGALIGGLSIGVTTKLIEPWSGAVLAKVLLLVAVIVFIQRRPKGLFPPTGRSAGD
ncbi:MAG: urea ABC transporter permease subunit UrtB [Pseudomonadota bacterium]